MGSFHVPAQSPTPARALCLLISRLLAFILLAHAFCKPLSLPAYPKPAPAICMHLLESTHLFAISAARMSLSGSIHSQLHACMPGQLGPIIYWATIVRAGLRFNLGAKLRYCTLPVSR